MTPRPPISTLFPYTTLFRSWNQHERSTQTFQGEWVRTGDKYRRDADGYFWYAGRADDMIKAGGMWVSPARSEEHTSELQSHSDLVCRLLLEKKKKTKNKPYT